MAGSAPFPCCADATTFAPALSAVRTTQALGAGWRPTFCHDAQARAKASAVWSSASAMSPMLAAPARRQGSQPASKNSANAAFIFRLTTY